MAGVRSSGWSEIKGGGARCHRRSYAIVTDGEHPGLVKERGNQYREKREGTGEREREPEGEREEKRKNEEKGERKGNIK